MSESEDLAALLFADGYNCSQAILAAYAEELGISEGVAYRLGSPFGAGMGRSGEVCGAVTGALMAVGLKYGHSDAADKDGKERAYTFARQVLEEFRRREGSTLCRDLLGCRIDQPEALEAARTQGVLDTVCPNAVATASRIVRAILDGEGPEQMESLRRRPTTR